nr:DNA primase [uncultured Mogibacterium sp.]
MAYGNNFIDEIKSKVNIVDIIGREVPLKQSGSNFKGLCPFHNEKTPSFTVNEQKQIFNCFGCGEKGDVIQFIQRFNNMEFMEACEKLAEEYNIEIPQHGTRKKVDMSHYYEINAMAARFFFNNLTKQSNPGYTYIRKRGISDETIKHFGLGYSLDSWNALHIHLQSKGIKDEDMLKLGLITQGKKGVYDKFRGRLMFPIFNPQGRVIGFGGRALGDEMPKYLNSSESDVFLKKNNLYALNFTKKNINDENQVLMVEGYMDVISLYQSGIRNVVASLGTALTDNQCQLITRYTKNVVLSYDSDAAGIKAALRGIEVMRASNANVRILQVTGGKDPDEFVKKYGKEDFIKLVNNAVPATEFSLDIMKKKYNLNDNLEIIEYIKACVPILRKLGAVEQDLYVKKLASEFDISEHAILTEIVSSDNMHNYSYSNKSHDKRDSRNNRYGNEERVEISLLYILTRDSRYLDTFKEDDIEFRTDLGRDFYDIASKLIWDKNLSEINIDDVYKGLDPEDEKTLRKILSNIRIGADESSYYKECYAKYVQMHYGEKIIELQNAIAVAEKLGNEEEISRLAMQLQGIEEKRRKVR